MKLLLSTILLTTSTTALLAQSYIYKRNAFGQIEVYSSSYGTPQGQPIARIVKNPLGYVEVQDLGSEKSITQAIDPYSRRTQLTAVKPFMAPTAQIVNTMNTYFGLVNKQKDMSQRVNGSQGLNEMKRLFDEMQTKFTDLISFYNTVTNKPEKVNDGWHNITSVSSNPMKAVFAGDKMIETGYAYVVNNRPQKLVLNDYTGGYMFETFPIIAGNVESCKAFYKLKSSGASYNSEIYFLDYILDTTTRASLPKIGTIRFVTNSSAELTAVGIYKKDPKIYGQTSENYVGAVYIGRDKQGQIVESNYFSSYVGDYFYIAMDAYKNTWTGAFNLSEGADATISLNLK